MCNMMPASDKASYVEPTNKLDMHDAMVNLLAISSTECRVLVIQGRMEVACANRVFHLHAVPEDDIVDQLSGGMPGAARLSPSHR